MDGAGDLSEMGDMDGGGIWMVRNKWMGTLEAVKDGGEEYDIAFEIGVSTKRGQVKKLNVLNPLPTMKQIP